MLQLLVMLCLRIKSLLLKSRLPFSLVLLVTACIPDPLELKEIPEVKPEIVVATQMIGNQSIVVLLTKTFSAQEVNNNMETEEFLRQIVINDALVTISGPDGTDTLSFRENGIYTEERLSLREMETYELRIYSDEYGTVTATTKVQRQVEMENVVADLYYKDLNDTLAMVSYQFQDPAEDNWYMLNVQKVGQSELGLNLINPKAFTHLIEDTRFNGLLYNEEYTFFPDNFAPGDTVLVTLSNISQEYFQFMKLRTEERLGFLEFLGEPSNYPSNIIGGKGYFNLYFPDTRLIILDSAL